jgi:hypothetical protein
MGPQRFGHLYWLRDELRLRSSIGKLPDRIQMRTAPDQAGGHGGIDGLWICMIPSQYKDLDKLLHAPARLQHGLEQVFIAFWELVFLPALKMDQTTGLAPEHFQVVFYFDTFFTATIRTWMRCYYPAVSYRLNAVNIHFQLDATICV